MIIVVGGIKGGSGKTTIATNLTVLRSITGKKVLLVDADEQESASMWSFQRKLQNIKTSWETIQLFGASIRSQIQKIIFDYDDIIIDVGGRDTTSQRSALTVADVFIIPFLPRSLDIWTLTKVKDLISEVSIINKNLKSYAVINKADSIGTDNEETIEILKNCPYLNCLPFLIGQRKIFANASTNGLAVSEMKVSNKKAVEEMCMLYSFLYQNDINTICK